MASDKRVKSIFIIFLALFTAVAAPMRVMGQQQEQIEAEAPPVVLEPPAVVGEGKAYTLGNEDILQITVRNQAEFSGQFVIGPDGKIQYTFVGDIEAAGLTKEQLKQRLIKELERFVKVPEVSISITAYKSKNIYVLGEVTRPGQYPMKGDSISLRDAIIAAGLHTRDAALRRVYIIKLAEEKVIPKKVDLFALLYKGRMKYNLNLAPGDIVVVPSTVPSEINRALNTLLQPVFNAAAVDALLYRDRR